MNWTDWLKLAAAIAVCLAATAQLVATFKLRQLMQLQLRGLGLTNEMMLLQTKQLSTPDRHDWLYDLEFQFYANPEDPKAKPIRLRISATTGGDSGEPVETVHLIPREG